MDHEIGKKEYLRKKTVEYTHFSYFSGLVPFVIIKTLKFKNLRLLFEQIHIIQLIMTDQNV